MHRLRSFSFLAVLLTILGGALHPGRALAQVSAYVIADNATGFILESSNPNKKLQVGSLTKIATALVVLDWSAAKGEDLGQQATVPASAQPLNTTGNGAGLQVGDRCSLRDLLYAALLQSDNQAAETLADHVGRALGGDRGNMQPVTYFVSQMNALARRLGMRNTRFLNPHGLDGLERGLPYSTAADLAILTRYAMERSSFRFYVSQSERRISIYTSSGDVSNYLLRNTNELLGQMGIDGVKTGTTRKAGQCLILSAPRPPESRQDGDKVIITPRRINVVILGSENRFAVGQQMISRGWSLYDQWAAAGRPEKGWKAER